QVEEPAVDRRHSVMRRSDPRSAVQLHRISCNTDFPAVFPEIYFNEIDILLAAEQLVEMPMFPYHALIDGCRVPCLGHHGDRIGRLPQSALHKPYESDYKVKDSCHAIKRS